MTDELVERLTPVPNLKSSMRRARLEEAERSDVLAELRGAEIARLEMLAEELEPIYAQLPDDVDIFDAGVIPGERPRLFVDMIGFIEMATDKRTYRFIQDTRHGRVIIKESDRAETMVATVTDYIARRLLERERALSSDLTIEQAARKLVGTQDVPKEQADTTLTQPAITEPPKSGTTGNIAPQKISTGQKSHKKDKVDTLASDAAPSRSMFAWLWDAIEFFALFIGFIVLLTALAGAIYFFWTMGDLGLITKFFKSGG